MLGYSCCLSVLVDACIAVRGGTRLKVEIPYCKAGRTHQDRKVFLKLTFMRTSFPSTIFLY